MAKILGLDLGTNSIGWALIDDKQNKILGIGSRIFPMGVINMEIRGLVHLPGCMSLKKSKMNYRFQSKVGLHRKTNLQWVQSLKSLKISVDFKLPALQ